MEPLHCIRYGSELNGMPTHPQRVVPPNNVSLGLLFPQTLNFDFLLSAKSLKACRFISLWSLTTGNVQFSYGVRTAFQIFRRLTKVSLWKRCLYNVQVAKFTSKSRVLCWGRGTWPTRKSNIEEFESRISAGSPENTGLPTSPDWAAFSVGESGLITCHNVTIRHSRRILFTRYH